MSTIDQHTKQGAAASMPNGALISRKVRILVAHNVSPERTGGMSRLMGFIHDEIASPDWEVNFFSNDRLPLGVGPLASRVVFPLLILRHLRCAWQKGEPYAIINVHEQSAALVVLLKWFVGRPRIVVMTYGLEQRAWELDKEESRLGRRSLSWRSRLTRPLTILWPSRLALKHADHIFCQNEEDRNRLEGWLALPSSKITRVYSGANTSFAEQAGVRTYQKAEKLLFAGTWRYQKGTPEVVAAFARLAIRNPSLTLTILGSGLDVETVRADFPESLRVRVRVVPTVDEVEAAREFAAADIYLLPSLLEGTPLTLIEAMVSGLPIVTTDTCGMKDVIRHGRNGLLIPIRSSQDLANSIQLLIENASMRARLGRAAHLDAQELYRWNRVAAPVMLAYQTLLRTVTGEIS